MDIKKTISFGTEIWPAEFFALRAGYLFKAVETLYRNNSGFSNENSSKNAWGGGVGIKISDYNTDYAIMPYSELGVTQRVSFLVNF